MPPCEVHVVPRVAAHAAQLASFLWFSFQQRRGPRATECTLSAAGTYSLKLRSGRHPTHVKYIKSLGRFILLGLLALELRALYFYTVQQNLCKIQVFVEWMENRWIMKHNKTQWKTITHKAFMSNCHWYINSWFPCYMQCLPKSTEYFQLPISN